MSRKATGSVVYKSSIKSRGVLCWHARVTTSEGRPYVPLLDPNDATGFLTRKDAESTARARAKGISKAMRGGAVPSDRGETITEYFDRWHASREKKIAAPRHDRGRFETWVKDVLGTLSMTAVQQVDLRRFVKTLDDAVLKNKLSAKTARNVWGLVSKMFADACKGKDDSLRVRQDNPTSNVAPPDLGVEKSGPYLYPSEFLTLMNCPDVLSGHKRAYALAIYTGLRQGELEELTQADVDGGFIDVNKARADDGSIKTPKGKNARKVPIEPHIAPLLKKLDVTMPNQMAEALREDLHAAGCKRAALFANDHTRRQINFHDLRHTYGTWRAIRGDDLFKIQRAMGHSDVATTQRYLNEAESFSKDFGTPFPPIPAIIRESSQNRPGGSGSSRKRVGEAGFENAENPAEASQMQPNPDERETITKTIEPDPPGPKPNRSGYLT